VVFDRAQCHRAFLVSSEPNDCAVDTGGDLELRSWAKFMLACYFLNPYPTLDLAAIPFFGGFYWVLVGMIAGACYGRRLISGRLRRD